MPTTVSLGFSFSLFRLLCISGLFKTKKEATSKPAAADATKTTEKSGPEAKLKGTGAKKQ